MDSNETPLYQPLEPSERRFRLLRLLEPRLHPIRCEMKIFSLLDDGTPPWKALSYRWGDDVPEFIVCLNDHPMLMRKGLQTFLLQINDEKQQNWYFIDALCIDQDNATEKSHQVQQMAKIYQQAEEVVVWIAYEGPSMQEVKLFQQAFGPASDQYDFSLPSSILIPAKDTRNGCSVSLNRTMAPLFVNSYWIRLWTSQELLLAKRLTFRIGSAQLEWSDSLSEELPVNSNGKPSMLRNLYCIIRKPTSIPPLIDNMRRAQNVLYYRSLNTKLLRSRKVLPFHEAVDYFITHRCSRPHDKVFAYLGLTDSRIQVDYSTPILDLFVATLAEYLISMGFRTGKLTELQFSQLQSSLKPPHLSVPLLLFDLDPRDPVVQLLIREVFEFFAPRVGKYLLATYASILGITFDIIRERQQPLISRKPEPKSMPSAFLAAIKWMVGLVSGLLILLEELYILWIKMNTLGKRDAVMSAPGKNNGSRRYSEWTAHAKEICEQMWQRFKVAGETEDADLTKRRRL